MYRDFRSRWAHALLFYLVGWWLLLGPIYAVLFVLTLPLKVWAFLRRMATPPRPCELQVHVSGELEN